MRHYECEFCHALTQHDIVTADRQRVCSLDCPAYQLYSRLTDDNASVHHHP